MRDFFFAQNGENNSALLVQSLSAAKKKSISFIQDA